MGRLRRSVSPAQMQMKRSASIVSVVSDRVIAREAIDDGTRWTLTAGGSDAQYGSTLHIEDDQGAIDAGGMGGPKLCGVAPV